MSSPSTNRFTLYLLSTLLLFCVSIANAQQKPRSNVSAITGQKFNSKKKKQQQKRQFNYINSIKGIFGVGVANYAGDLCKGFGCTKPRPSIVAGVEYRLDESITLRSELTWIRIAGTDAGGDYEYRNLSFRADNFEFTGAVMYDIFHYEKMYRRRHFASPYVFVGIGLTTISPKAQYNGEWHALRPLQTGGQSYSPIALVIPYGGGAKFKINPSLNITAEVGLRWVFSDYLDDVSGKYDPKIKNDENEIRAALSDRREEYLREQVVPGEGALSASERNQLSKSNNELYNLAYKASDRGGSDSNDGYMVFQIKAEYTLKVTKQHYNINSNVNRFRLIKSIKKK